MLYDKFDGSFIFLIHHKYYYTLYYKPRCPVLIIHGTNDDVVPFWHGDELLRSFRPQYRAQPYWVDGLGHNQIEHKRKEEYTKRVKSFIDKYVIPSIDRQSRKAMCVPVHEQYKPEKSLRDSGKFIVNQTWMRHGVAIVNEAIQEKKKGSPNDDDKIKNPAEHPIQSSGKQKQFRDSTNLDKKCDVQSVKNPIHKVDLNRVNTEDLLAKVKHARSNNMKTATTATYITTTFKEPSPTYQLSRSESNQSMQSAASRFIMTKESWATTNDEAEVSFDSVINKGGTSKGVSLQTFSDTNVSINSIATSAIHNACDLSYNNKDDTQSSSLIESFDRYCIED